MVARRWVLVFSVVMLGACGSVTRQSDEDGGQPDSGVSGGAGGNSGSGGSGGRGGNTPACMPKDSACYPSGQPGGPGSECLAQRDNSGATRVQTRRVWARQMPPKGDIGETVYDILRTRSDFDWPLCGSPSGVGGFIQLFDWDRSNRDLVMQTVRIGYATYHKSPAPSPAPGDLVRDGLCMAEYERTSDGDPFGELALPSGAGLPYPWRIRPIVSKRVAADFDAREFFGDLIPEGEGRVFIDERSGYVHGYMPLAWTLVLDSRASGMAIPIRQLEIKSQFNDDTFNCAGRYRADALDPSRSCDSSQPHNPTWGCEDDRVCPPPGLEEESGTRGPGAGTTLSRGYHLIVDLERVFSVSLGSTLCVSFQGNSIEEQVVQGWAVRTPDGANCRGGSRWNPALPNDAGLPMGDWCSRANSPATATCHDAFRNVLFTAEQAFKVKDGTCPIGTL